MEKEIDNFISQTIDLKIHEIFYIVQQKNNRSGDISIDLQIELDILKIELKNIIKKQINGIKK